MTQTRYTYAELEAACKKVLDRTDLDLIINADQTAPTAEDAILNGILEVEDSPATNLQAALRRLDPEERAIVEAAYGLDGASPITIEEATQLWGARAQPLLAQGLDSLRADLARFI
jgi:DNA-directed RNA polymerase sigma subunit (sigma70/sigma32)